MSVATSQGSILRGWATKLGGVVKSWKRRYMILLPTYIFYFADEKCAKHKGTILLNLLTTTRRLQLPQRPHCLGISTPDPATKVCEREYIISFDDESQLDSWFFHVNVCVSGEDSQPAPRESRRMQDEDSERNARGRELPSSASSLSSSSMSSPPAAKAAVENDDDMLIVASNEILPPREDSHVPLVLSPSTQKSSSEVVNSALNSLDDELEYQTEQTIQKITNLTVQNNRSATSVYVDDFKSLLYDLLAKYDSRSSNSEEIEIGNISLKDDINSGDKFHLFTEEDIQSLVDEALFENISESVSKSNMDSFGFLSEPSCKLEEILVVDERLLSPKWGIEHLQQGQVAEVWYLPSGETTLIPVPEHQRGIFFSETMFVILYIFEHPLTLKDFGEISSNRTGQKQHVLSSVLFVWEGRDTPASEYLRWKLWMQDGVLDSIDEQIHCRPHVVRVHELQESLFFTHIFHAKYCIFSGMYHPIRNDQQFCLRLTGSVNEGFRAVQVPLHIWRLASEDCFIFRLLRTSSKGDSSWSTILWLGYCSLVHERASARRFAQFIDNVLHLDAANDIKNDAHESVISSELGVSSSSVGSRTLSSGGLQVVESFRRDRQLVDSSNPKLREINSDLQVADLSDVVDNDKEPPESKAGWTLEDVRVLHSRVPADAIRSSEQELQSSIRHSIDEMIDVSRVSVDDVRIYEEFDEPASFFDSFARVGDSCSSETSQCDIKTLRPHLLPLYSNAFHASNERIAEFVQPLYFRIRSSGIMTLLRPPLAFSRFDAEDCYMIDHRPSGRIFLWIGHLTSFRHRLLTLIISKRLQRLREVELSGVGMKINICIAFQFEEPSEWFSMMLFDYDKSKFSVKPSDPREDREQALREAGLLMETGSVGNVRSSQRTR